MASDPDRTAPNPQDGSSDAVLAKLVWDNGPTASGLTGEWLDSRSKPRCSPASAPPSCLVPARVMERSMP